MACMIKKPLLPLRLSMDLRQYKKQIWSSRQTEVGRLPAHIWSLSVSFYQSLICMCTWGIFSFEILKYSQLGIVSHSTLQPLNWIPNLGLPSVLHPHYFYRTGILISNIKMYKNTQMGFLHLFSFYPCWFPVSNSVDHPKWVKEETSKTLNLASASLVVSNQCLNILLCSGFCAVWGSPWPWLS